MRSLKNLLMMCSLVLITTAVHARDMPPIKPVAQVDLSRFMGTWYVIASIPTRFEKNAFNAVETYAMQEDGHVQTSFRFRQGAFDKPVKTIKSTGFVKAGSNNAIWGVQVIWPIKAQYVVAYLNDDYSQTIIARDARDYTWIMARSPTITQTDYDALIARAKAMGYSVDAIRKVPQAWPETGP